MPKKGTRKVCDNGHTFYKSSDCPTCPTCEKLKEPASGFLGLLSNPARNTLLYYEINTIQKLAGYTEKEILAPQNPMKHAIILGIIGTVLSAVGAVVAADLGPVWYAWTLAVIAIPIAWLGGKLYEMKHAASGSEYIIKQ